MLNFLHSHEQQQWNCYFAIVEQMWSPNDTAEFYFRFMHIFKLGEKIGFDIYGQQSSCCTAILSLSISWNRQPWRSGALFWRECPHPISSLEKAHGMKRLLGSYGCSYPSRLFSNYQSDLFQPKQNHVMSWWRTMGYITLKMKSRVLKLAQGCAWSDSSFSHHASHPLHTPF